MFKYCELKALWQDEEFLEISSAKKSSRREGRKGFTLSSEGCEWKQNYLGSNNLARLIDKHKAELSEEAFKRLSEWDELRLVTPLTVPLPPERSPYGHKHDYGHVFVLAGSRDMPGAGNLSAVAALRAGTGLVTRFMTGLIKTAVPDEIILHYLNNNLTLSLHSDYNYNHAKYIGCCGHAEEILKSLRGEKSVLLVGPGLTKESKKCVLEVIKKTDTPTVIDATALSFITPKTKLPPKTVLTPHSGEAAKLLGVSTAEVQDNRAAAAKELATKYKAIIVLKGAFTIVCSEGEAALSDIANPYLATAGSGDVLAGVIAAYIAQGMEPKDAAEAAVYIHGLAGELASEASGGEILAGDIANYLAKAKCYVRQTSTCD